MRTVTVRDLQKKVKECVDDAQNDRVVITRRGKPAAVLVGVEGEDWEAVVLQTDPAFWKLVRARRRQPTISLRELEARVGIRRSPVRATRPRRVRRVSPRQIKLIHDAVGHTLTIWFDDPAQEHACEETTEEIVFMKDAGGRVIGLELLHYRPANAESGLVVETVVLTEV